MSNKNEIVINKLADLLVDRANIIKCNIEQIEKALEIYKTNLDQIGKINSYFKQKINDILNKKFVDKDTELPMNIDEIKDIILSIFNEREENIY